MFLGAHVSIAGGLHLAPGRGREIGCEAIQIFSKNQLRWRAKPLEDEEAEAFKSSVKEAGLASVVIHDSYLINLADSQKEGLEKSREAFVDEMERAQRLGVQYLIFHPGAHKGVGEEFGIGRIAESIDYCVSTAEAPDVVLLLECTAGQGSTLGYTFEQLRDIREAVEEQSRVGYCFDTCHLFASGYDICGGEGYETVMQQASEILGLGAVKAFHLNDSKRELGSRVDRHEQIGEGQIGLEAFRMLVNDRRFRNVPMVLETPGDDDHFRRNLEVLRSLRKA
ncbi:MAG: deoxyribonuclease IV [Thermoplasmata archaeon]